MDYEAGLVTFGKSTGCSLGDGTDRSRKRTKYDWLCYEIVPQLSFENEYDYKANPGIRLRLEFFFGADTANQFWSRESEDIEDFRW
jgi:hypothetical protein